MSKFPYAKISPWLDEPTDIQPSLKSDISADVVIIGGGYTGLYTALNLHEAGVNVVVLEKEFAGAGGSGRNSGYVDALIGKDFASLLKIYKIDRARKLCDFSKEAIRRLENFIKENHIDCEYIPNGNVMAAVHPKQLKRLKKTAGAGEALGLDFEYLGPDAIRERDIPYPFVAGVFDSIGGTLNPGKLISHLRKMALDKGIKIYENTEVLELTNTAPVVARCPEGSVKAAKALLATNAYTNDLGYKKRLVTPICAAMVESEPLTDEQMRAIGWKGKEGIYTVHEQLENYRLTARNTIVTGGKYVKIPYGYKITGTYLPDLFTKIEAIFRERFYKFPDIKMKSFWGGWIGMIIDFMPVLGVTGKEKNIHFGIGYSGHGIPQSIMVGEMLSEQLQGKEHPMAKLLDRRVLTIPPEPIKSMIAHSMSGFFTMLDNITDKQARRMRTD